MTSILSLLASIAGIVATYWIGKKVTAWLQAYRYTRQKSEELALKKETEELARKAQEESDRLKEIEGR